MNTSKLPPLCLTPNIVERNNLKKYLTMPVTEVVRLLFQEKDAKNIAYQFIIDKGLTHEFKAMRFKY